jgi:hypothetical protein
VALEALRLDIMKHEQLVQALAALALPGRPCTREEARDEAAALATRFGAPAATWNFWDHLAESSSVQDPDGWRWAPELLGTGSIVLLVEDSGRWGGVRLEHAPDAVALLGECAGFEVALATTDRGSLVWLNHHDFVIAAGAARAVLEGRRS